MSKQPSYIRCIKPNDFKRDGIFDETIISHQVKYLGLMENLRVRRAGFCYRRNLGFFLQRSATSSSNLLHTCTCTYVCTVRTLNIYTYVRTYVCTVTYITFDHCTVSDITRGGALGAPLPRALTSAIFLWLNLRMYSTFRKIPLK